MHRAHRSHRSNRVLHLAVAGLLTAGLTACGGDDEAPDGTTPPAATTTPADDAATTSESPAAGGALDDVGQTGAAADGTGTTADGTADGAGATGELADGVPALDEIWPDVLAAAEEADAVTATMSGELDGQSMSMDVQGQRDDSEYQVDMEVDDMAASVIQVDDVVYVKGNAGFWESSGAPADQAQELADQWVEAPEGMAPEGVSVSFLFDELTAMDSSGADLAGASGELGEHEGRSVYRYALQDQGLQVMISAEGDPQLVLLDVTDGPEPMTIHILDWDAEPVEAPADAVPIEELTGGAGR